METSPTSRLTVALALAAIVAAIGLLVAGLVLAPSGEAGDVEASLAVGAAEVHDQSTDGRAAPAAAHGAEDADGHAHADDASPGTTAAHDAHDGPTSLAASGGHGHDTLAVQVPGSPTVPTSVADDGHHEVATAEPTDAPSTPAPTPAHDHAAPVVTVPNAPTTTVPGPVVSLDDPRLSADQRAAASSLLDRTRSAMAKFPDEAAVKAAGYVSIGDGITGFEHYVHVDYLADDAELDADRIESIVLRLSGGTKTVESAMYILTTGATMADVPEIAGELTTWHDHQNLCWNGIRVVAVTRADGTCPRGEFRPTPPMLHVWLADQPCGPFTGIEGVHGTTCAHSGH